jgi:uncharacterized protein YkwD
VSGVVFSTLAVLGLTASLQLPTAASAPAERAGRSVSCAYANLRPTAADTAAVDAATLCLIDRIRIARRLRPLRANRELQTVATRLVGGMVSGDYYSDDSPSGQSPGALIAALPYGARAARLSTAQDLGWGTLSAATPAGIVRAWMHSPQHRQIILTAAYRDVGIGVVAAVPTVLASGRRGATYAVEFGARG